ncbi:spore photoproduct lyase [Moorella sp. E308F]|nr:spore photoproduct lyase [Moorella sp. E308F]GEA16457.1 spore photoproduct lyase [Moorella sp. E308F]
MIKTSADIKRVVFEPAALNYPLGKKLYHAFRQKGLEILFTPSHNRVTCVPGRSVQESFMEAKRTLVVGVRRSRHLETCKPSAHYQLPLATSCPAMCEYCYLFTHFGRRPYQRVYVNLSEILELAGEYIERRKPEVTVFEAAATSDPLPVEKYTGNLARTIEFMGNQPLGRLRVVTKFTDVANLLGLDHRGHTRFRFSINAANIIKRFEHGTPPLAERLAAALKIVKAGYLPGFIIAPIFYLDGWQEQYRALFQEIARQPLLAEQNDLTLELITHRFTKKAKTTIETLFPKTELPLDEENRTFKYGQFGYGKYVYPAKVKTEIESFFKEIVAAYLPRATIEYFI